MGFSNLNSTITKCYICGKKITKHYTEDYESEFFDYYSPINENVLVRISSYALESFEKFDKNQTTEYKAFILILRKKIEAMKEGELKIDSDLLKDKFFKTF